MLHKDMRIIMEGSWWYWNTMYEGGDASSSFRGAEKVEGGENVW